MQRVCMASLHATSCYCCLYSWPSHSISIQSLLDQGIRRAKKNGMASLRNEIILLFSSGDFVISCLCMIILCCPASRNSVLADPDR